MSSFPKRAFIQVFKETEWDRGKLPHDYTFVVEEMKSRDIPVTYWDTDDILSSFRMMTPTRDDLVVGNFDWTRIALRRLGISMPVPPDYPVCLQHLLYRKVWQSTLGEVQQWIKRNVSKQVFIKPAADAKIFSAIIEPKDQMLDMLLLGLPGIPFLPANLQVYCAEVVNMISEYRVYIVDGKIRNVCQYRGPILEGDVGYVKLDMNVVEQAVVTLCSSDEGKHLKGCGVDFAVMKKDDGSLVTCLIEVNDGFSLGLYPGLSGKDYTDLLITRWHELMTTGK